MVINSKFLFCIILENMNIRSYCFKNSEGNSDIKKNYLNICCSWLIGLEIKNLKKYRSFNYLYQIERNMFLCRYGFVLQLTC